MRLEISRKAGAVLTGVTFALVAAQSASANILSAGPLVQVPAPSVFAASSACVRTIVDDSAQGDLNFTGSAVEPMVAADPANPLRLVAAYQEGIWSDGGSNSDLGVVSTDGGQSWTLSTVQAPFSVCTGGQLRRAADAVIAFSSDGATVYQAAEAIDTTAGVTAIEVSTSTDGGDKWSAPQVLNRDSEFGILNDKDWITADPTNPLKAYVVWDRLVLPTAGLDESEGGPALLSQTSDAGANWSVPKVIYDPGVGDQTIGNQIVAPARGRAAGDLLDFFLSIHRRPVGDTADIELIRSRDGGTTWSSPTTISPVVPAGAHGLIFAPWRTGELTPAFTADPKTGTLYAAWQDGSFSRFAPKIAFSQSVDGGQTWSAPIKIDQAPGVFVQAFTPQIAVNSEGTIGVSYYDGENAGPGNRSAVDEYIVHCHAKYEDCANPASWAAGGETRLSTSGSFDMRSAPIVDGERFTGDYEGLAASGTDFVSLFVMARPIATSGLTDVFSTTAQ